MNPEETKGQGGRGSSSIIVVCNEEEDEDQKGVNGGIYCNNKNNTGQSSTQE